MKKHIPNTLTLFNAFSGFVGIVAVLNGQWRLAFYMMIAAVIFDLLDGMVARLLNVQSELGMQLDSLADVISFGLLPGIMMYQLFVNSPNLPQITIQNTHIYIPSIVPLLAAFIPMMSVLRLAKFNIDTRQTSSFIGLPTPANALFIGSFSMSIYSYCSCDPVMQFLHSWPVLTVILVAFSLLLVAELPLFSFKFKNLKWKENTVQYSYLIIMLLVSIGVFVDQGPSKWFLIINYGVFYYIIHSLIARYIFKKTF